MKKYWRKCDECGHKQEARDPKTYKNDSWRDLKCKKCGSMGMDYGKWEDTEGNKSIEEGIDDWW